jgi:hypothetical protein
MKIFIGLISSNEKICDVFRKKQDSLIPDETRTCEKIKSLNPVFNIGVCNPRQDSCGVEKFIALNKEFRSCPFVE